jgi:imidazolonepropionase-like amidohydrolase
MQAIQSATTSAADLLGKSEILGSIDPGKYADIVAAPDNPLDDVRAIEHITFVMKEGKIYKQPN